jgi:hypothetical protein
MGLWYVEAPAGPGVTANVANHCTLADARLIAAAPDLMTAVQEAESLIGSFGDLSHDRPMERGLAKLRAAIAKAAGGS